MSKIEALLRMVLNDQAYLFALIMQLKAESGGNVVTDEQFEQWQDEWAELTAESVNVLMESGDNE